VVTLQRHQDVVQREVAGELFLVPIRTHLADLNSLFVLNETGNWVWQRIEGGGSSLAELAAGLTREFDVDEQTAQVDVEVFCRQLVESGLAQWVDGEV
jgi:hypothetical protein